jgi:hypothetical protein
MGFGRVAVGWVPAVVGTAVLGEVVLGAAGVVGLVAGAFGVGVFVVDDEVQPVAVTRPNATSPIHDDLMASILPVQANV